MKIRIIALLILLVGAGLAYFAYLPTFPFHLGLDLSGGTHLVYKADISGIQSGEVKNSIEALRDIIERRVNLFGVSEPRVQSISAGDEERLIVDLPGVTDVSQAVALIGQTPVLEFKTEAPLDSEERASAMTAEEEILRLIQEGGEPSAELLKEADGFYQNTSLTGRFLQRASVQFDQSGVGLVQEPQVLLAFDKEGAEMFAQITSENVGKTVAIYLDGAPISTPVVIQPITDGNAVISGTFTPQGARELVGRLNAGALPVPIELLSTQSIGATLGHTAVEEGLRAGLIGLALVAIFMLVWYRLPGLVSVLALAVYVSIMLTLFKLLPVTLTASGIAGFILTIGMAVDANVLIFERMKEELRKGKRLEDSVREGFKRAWPSIRDGNFTSIMTAIILFYTSTSLIQGFALTFGIGVLVSMLSAILVTRVFLLALPLVENRGWRYLFNS
ncbi:MAG: protein translocase subunit SecD [Candidatus Vogelbacteria bacterium CG10_big_fil_rev_8_21_14_0_10_45_14]|uniref:Protein translocase subunit SecD n=1 Tax=Candidatus Vogelbacteria bacterium CG10_big_fil_rev_8_21_14_0_10_45_14 TaxID=1975042 RepID=A0A2H0RK72_9BACT|nr:MAG: protein translocase subunit SecD [Candidatus Vogelbacteria bacterium CG10_big_fil_rev_8_21_14_0_10_45_14]